MGHPRPISIDLLVRLKRKMVAGETMMKFGEPATENGVVKMVENK